MHFRHGLAISIVFVQLIAWAIKCSIIVLVLAFRIPFYILGVIAFGSPVPKHHPSYAVPIQGKKGKYVIVPHKSWLTRSQEAVDRFINPPQPVATTAPTSAQPVATKPVRDYDMSRDYKDLIIGLKHLGVTSARAKVVATEVYDELGEVGLEKLMSLALKRLNAR